MSDLPFRVYSQMRSGTHLLMALLHANFDFGRDLSMKVSLPGQQFDGESEAEVPWADLFGSHQPNDGELDLSKAVYVLRHPIARAYSLWRFGNDGETFDDFATAKLFADWLAHAESFGVEEGKVLTVRYEQMRESGNEFRGVLAEIQERWRLNRRHSELQHVGRPVGWSPREGQASYQWSRLVVDRARDTLGGSCLGYDIA